MEHKLHCHVYEARLLSDICPVQSFPCYGFKVHINIFLLRKSRNFSGLFFHVSHQNPLHVSLFDLRIPRPIHVMCIDLFARIFTSRVTDINKMSHQKILLACSYLLQLNPNIFRSALFSFILNSFFPIMLEAKFQSHKSENLSFYRKVFQFLLLYTIF